MKKATTKEDDDRPKTPVIEDISLKDLIPVYSLKYL